MSAGTPVTVELPSEVFRRGDRDALKRRFDEEHLRRYGTCAPEEAAEIVSLRATVTGAMKKRRSSASRAAGARRFPPRTRQAQGLFCRAREVARDAELRARGLRAGNRIEGPALVEEHASTTSSCR